MTTQETINNHFQQCINNANKKGNKARAIHAEFQRMECLKKPNQWSFVQRCAIDNVTGHVINKMYGNQWEGNQEQANEVFNTIVNLYIIEDTDENWEAFQLAAEGKLSTALAKEVDFNNVF